MLIYYRASLVPIFSFGENDLFCQANNPVGSLLRRFQDTFKNIVGFSPPLFYGRGVFNYTFGLVPFRKPVHTVGKQSIGLCLIYSFSMFSTPYIIRKFALLLLWCSCSCLQTLLFFFLAACQSVCLSTCQSV